MAIDPDCPWSLFSDSRVTLCPVMAENELCAFSRKLTRGPFRTQHHVGKPVADFAHAMTHETGISGHPLSRQHLDNDLIRLAQMRILVLKPLT